MNSNRNHVWVRVRNDWLPGIYGCIKNSRAFSECAADHHISDSSCHYRALNLLLPLPLLSSVHCTSCQSCPVNRGFCAITTLRPCHAAAAATTTATTTVSKLCPPYILSIAHPVNRTSCHSRILSITQNA